MMWRQTPECQGTARTGLRESKSGLQDAQYAGCAMSSHLKHQRQAHKAATATGPTDSSVLIRPERTTGHPGIPCSTSETGQGTDTPR